MGKVVWTDGSLIHTVEGDYVRALYTEEPTPGQTVLLFLDSLDPGAFRQLVQNELDNGGMAADPVDIVVGALRQVAAGA